MSLAVHVEQYGWALGCLARQLHEQPLPDRDVCGHKGLPQPPAKQRRAQDGVHHEKDAKEPKRGRDFREDLDGDRDLHACMHAYMHTHTHTRKQASKHACMHPRPTFSITTCSWKFGNARRRRARRRRRSTRSSMKFVASSQSRRRSAWSLHDACTRVCKYVSMYVSMYVCMYVCMYACIHPCTYITTHTHTHIPTQSSRAFLRC